MDQTTSDQNTLKMPSNTPRPAQEVLAQAKLLLEGVPDSERLARLTGLLQSALGNRIREQIASAILELLHLDLLVPEAYRQWRPLVSDALRFLLLRMSVSRLAPKILEQLELSPDARSEDRLLRFIARMPGFQKLGQVLARNRHLLPSLRDELITLENSISDANASEMLAIVAGQLGSRLQNFAVEIEPELLSEATVSAVLRFTWRNPAAQQRERGVFKVIKPHVPVCFAEDMELLHQLSEHLEARHDEYGFAANVIADTFTEVRQLLQHEMDYTQEQSALLQASALYRSVAGIRTPRLIAPLCGPQITAMTEESGIKVTDAAAAMPAWRRPLIAAQIVECLIAVPLFAPGTATMFHADPHAGNLFYDRHTGELVLLDWSLTGQLTHLQRRHLVLLCILFALRDAPGMCRQIQSLSAAERPDDGAQNRIIHRCVARALEQLPWASMPRLIDVTRLLDDLAREGVVFPPALLLFRKSLFTLDGILHEIAGSRISIEFILARCFVERCLANWPGVEAPLLPADWLTVQWSALFYGPRVWTESIGS
jgi:ubiquinone biosynthesis protein